MSRRMVRFQEVVIPILRAGLPPEVTVSSWVNDIDYREYPVVNVRRLGGMRAKSRFDLLDHPVVEITVLHGEGLVEAENLYLDVLEILHDAARRQTVLDSGYLLYVNETMGMTQFSSLFQDSFRVQGLIECGIRPTP